MSIRSADLASPGRANNGNTPVRHYDTIRHLSHREALTWLESDNYNHDSMEMVLTGVFEEKGDCWIAWVEELRGANSQGRTLEEAKGNLREAISMVLAARREIAEQELQGKNVIREQFCFT